MGIWLVSRETVLYHPRLLCSLLQCSLGITVISPILQLKGAGPQTPESLPHSTPLPPPAAVSQKPPAHPVQKKKK